MSIDVQLSSPVRRAVGAARELLVGDPTEVSADGERGLAGLLWQCSEDELDLALAELRAVEAIAAGLRLAMVREARRRGMQQRTGAPDIEHWLADRYALDRTVCRAEAGLALVCGSGHVGEPTGTALAEGRIGEARARLVLETLDRLPGGLSDEVVTEAQELLLAVAEHGDSASVRRAGRKIVEQLTTLSEDGPEPVAPPLYNQLDIRPAGIPGWWRLSGLLDDEHSAIIGAAIDALTAPGRQPTGPARDAAAPTSGGPSQSGAAATSPHHACTHDVAIMGDAMVAAQTDGGVDRADASAVTEGSTDLGAGGPGGMDLAGKVVGGSAGADPPGRQLCADGPPSRGWEDDDPPGGRAIADPPLRALFDNEPAVDPDDGALRPIAERRADAIAELAAVALRSGLLPSRGGTPATVLVTVTLPDLQRRLAAAGLLDTGTSLLAVDAWRLACDAGLVPAVLSATGEPLYLGRTTRTLSVAIRRALALRDRGCTFPHCASPPARCDGHHIVHWADGGPTDLTNLALLCPFHHRLVHRQQWQLRLQRGRIEFVPPASVDPWQRPRIHFRSQPSVVRRG